MNLPNKLTVLRMVLIPFMMFFYLATFIPHGIGKIVALVIFVVAALTDLLDGKIARKHNLVTNLGKFLDPIADKLLVFAALILICVDHTIPPVFAELVLFIMLARDFIIGALRQVGASNNVIISADNLGKLKTVLQDIALSVLLVVSGLVSAGVIGVFTTILLWIGYVTIGLATIVSIISGVNYCIKNKQVFKG